MVDILGYGVYIPKYRLKQEEPTKVWGGGARGEKSVCSTDEDIVTMAVEAAEKAIQHSGIEPSRIGSIHLGTSSSPYVENYISTIIAETLGVEPDASIVDHSGSLNVASTALQSCMDAINSKRIDYGLVIGTENRVAAPGSEGEVSFGAGAAAFVVGNNGNIAGIEGISTHSTLMIDRWRSVSDSHVSNYFDYRFARKEGYEKHTIEAINGLFEELGKKCDDFSHVVLQQPDLRLPASVAKKIGANKEQMSIGMIYPFFGDLGSCSVFVGLVAILDKARPKERILLVSYGSGSSSASQTKRTDTIGFLWFR
jgi:hydroxymethylglutaryl-CoA synthase